MAKKSATTPPPEATPVDETASDSAVATLDADASATEENVGIPITSTPEPEPAPQAAPAEERIRTSPVRATGGRVLLVFCPDSFEGPRPGFVVKASALCDEDLALGVPPQQVHINVQVDGIRDAKLLDQIRRRPEGTTFELNVYDHLSAEQRRRLVEQRPTGITRHQPMWAEWTIKNHSVSKT
jgi:hypothetical protein